MTEKIGMVVIPDLTRLGEALRRSLGRESRIVAGVTRLFQRKWALMYLIEASREGRILVQ